MSDTEAATSESEISEQSIVTVVDVERYMIDPVFVQQTGLTGHRVHDAYDLTVADGHYKRKIVLSSALNRLIQKRMVSVGDSIRLKKVNIRFDETSLNGSGIPIAEELEVIKDGTDINLDALSDLPWHPDDSKNQQDPQPLASARLYYVDLWSNADVVKTADTFEVVLKDSLEGVSSEDLYRLREVAQNWHRIKDLKPHLLLRVLRRPRLVHYARPNRTDKWPFQLPLVVGDETGCCVAVLWNVMAPRYLHHMPEGTVLLLRNFTVKPRFRLPGHQVWHPAGLPWFDVDLNINAQKPAGEVTLLNPSVLDDLHDVHLPLPDAKFVSRQQLGFLPDDFVCDVGGVITFVGALKREKTKAKQGSDSSEFWVKRWVHLQDNSSSRPIIVELYRGTQRAEFEDEIVTGRVLVCRHMRVVHGLSHLQSSWQHLHVYVTSTKDTQIYILHKGENRDFAFCHDRTLQCVIDWAATASFQDSGSRKLSEISFTYPLHPTTLDGYSTLHENMEIVPCEGWKAFVENLSYRESTRLVVQAELAALTCHWKTASVPIRALHKRKGSPAQVRSVSLERREASELDTCEHLGYVDIHLHASESEESTSSLAHHSSDLLSCFTDQDCLCLQWRGLNAGVVLHTFKVLSLSSSLINLSLEALLSGSLDAAPGEAAVKIGEETVQKLVSSWKDRGPSSVSQRYLVVINVYCVDGRTVLMSVDRAFPVR